MSATHLEREAKLAATEDFSLARLPRQLDEYVAAPAQFRRLHTIYYDTEDLRLARWGCSLRYRVNEGWTLKLLQPGGPNDAALFRKEYVYEGDRQNVPEQALKLACAYLRAAPVVRVAELRTLRTKRTIRASDEGDVVAEIADDDVRVVAGARVIERFREVEIESVNGDGDALASLQAALQRQGAGGIYPVAKNQRVSHVTESELPRSPVHRSSSVAEVFAAAFAGAAERLIRLDAALRSDSDPEMLHDFRTAVRRLRSYLRSFRPVLDRAWAQTLRDKLDWINRLVANARNVDVLIEMLESSARELEPADAANAPALFEHLKRERDLAYDSVRAGLSEPRYTALLDDIVSAARRPVFRRKAGKRSRKCEAVVLSGARKRLCRVVRCATTPAAERDLHAVRIKAKHLRFAAEAFVAVRGRRVKCIAGLAKRLQTVLGNHHDAVVALRHLRRIGRDAKFAFVAGQLAERSRIAAWESRQQWRRAFRRVMRKA